MGCVIASHGRYRVSASRSPASCPRADGDPAADLCSERGGVDRHVAGVAGHSSAPISSILRRPSGAPSAFHRRNHRLGKSGRAGAAAQSAVRVLSPTAPSTPCRSCCAVLQHDPDWTVGIKPGRDGSASYHLLNMVRAGQRGPARTSDCCSIPPSKTARGSASGSAKIRGRLARDRHINCLRYGTEQHGYADDRVPRSSTACRRFSAHHLS